MVVWFYDVIRTVCGAVVRSYCMITGAFSMLAYGRGVFLLYSHKGFTVWSQDAIIGFMVWSHDAIIGFMVWSHDAIIGFMVWSHDAIIGFMVWSHDVTIRGLRGGLTMILRVYGVVSRCDHRV